MNFLYLKCGKETLEYQKLKEIRKVEIERRKRKRRENVDCRRN